MTRVTKKELEAKVEQLEALVAEARVTALKEKETGEAYIAKEDPGQPVCYVGTYSDKGLCINIYRDKQGDALGVLVYDGYELLSASGLFPAEVLAQEIRSW